MDTHATLLGRRTVHQFTRDPVPAEVVERALAAAHHAPCHKHTWPWRFLVAGPETRARLADVAVALKSATAPLPPAQQDAVRAASSIPARWW